VDILVKTTDAKLMPALSAGVRAELDDSPITVRDLYARVPGVASEPVTTAILVAVASHVAVKVGEKLFASVSQWVRKHKAQVTVEVAGAEHGPVGKRLVVINPTDIDDEEARARLLALISEAER
jgi:hypothetical protein